ncbi:disease resistance protein RUN1 [Trifolium repens]|nr:disease resistance protein RUN1 [Trifolium repens]
MASSSNSSSLALVTLPKKRKNCYDVFVTFRGVDTRNNFTDFLFNALEDKRVSVFKDGINLPKGETIGPELLRAIEDSQIFVVIFSKNYASSTWCLQELEKICECVQVSRKHVLPVFYDVDPSEVRKQSGIYGEAFIKHEQRFQLDYEISMVQRWRKALTQVGTISGWDVRYKPQAAQIKEIVQRIINILDGTFISCLSKDLVGMDSPIQELQSHLLLNSVDDVLAIGISGMGGIGKTTLATALYGRVSSQFDATCFIDDVSKVYRSHDGPLGAQKQILHQTVGKKHNQIWNNHDAINLMQRRLGRVRTLLILDNVDHVKQLEIIPMNREWLGAGSRIIIISRDEHILIKFGVDVVYKVPLLNKTNSLELFCRQAFKLDHILNSYEGLVSSILHYTNGLPLAIEVLGSFLYGLNISEWESALSRLRESPDKDVMDVLQISFDGLVKAEKEIFLHIACFFNSIDAYYVKNILNCCGFHADIGLRILIDKSLIRIKYGRIRMHNLLEELGRKIVQKNSSKKSRKWKRLWLCNQFPDVMSDHMEKNVQAMVLHTELNKSLNLMMDAVMLEYFSNLRLLIIKGEMNEYGNVSGSLSCLSNELRYVEWFEYPFMYLPLSFQPIQLVELILVKSSIKQLWRAKKYLPNLKNLCLSNSRNLIEMPNFIEEFPNLEQLNLEGCVKLVKLDPSIGLLRKIVYLNLKDCISLISIPTNTIFGITSLKYINMSGCSKLFFNNQRASHSLQSTSPSSNVPHRFIIPYSPLPFSAQWLYCLSAIDISFCGLHQLPAAIGCLRQLQSLNLMANNFVSLLCLNLNQLSKLVYLNLNHCKFLESLPQLPFPTAINWDLDTNSGPLRKGLHIFNCPKLGERECQIAFSWMKQFIQANPQISDVIDMFIPGSEIPSWLNNQSEGNTILIDYSPIKHDINNDIIGLLCSSVFSIHPINRNSQDSHNHCIELHLTGFCLDGIENELYGPTHQSYLPISYEKRDLIKVKRNHIWLTYFPRKLSWYVLDIHSKMHVKFHNPDGWVNNEVKNCGYGWLHKQDLQEFNLKTLHPGNSSALKHKFLAIEDEAQQQHNYIHSSD